MRHRIYRADIDGLRAIAVMSVVIQHVSNTLLPGGFVGVDIFFVISGFLITSQIYEEIKAGLFSLRKFYKRRINRIVPALLTVVMVCLLVGAFLLSPAELTRLSFSAFLSLVGLSNIYFWQEYGNYFQDDTAEAILLHTWSLGVEEQFYVIWPLLLLLLVKLAPRYTVLVLAGVTLLAIALSEYATTVVASASYYLLPMRFFELMIGGLLAIIVAHNRLMTRFYASVCEVIGFALIAYALFMLGKESSYPGFNGLIPCLGAALLIWAGSSGHPSSILQNKTMVFLGLISYSLYLWHWPIIAYLNWLNVPIGVTGGGGLVIAGSILLAWLSWKYVEIPFRSNGATLPFSRVFTARFAVPATVVLLLNGLIVHFHGFPERFDPIVSSFEAMAAAKPNEIRSRCHAPNTLYKTEPNTKCRLGFEKENIDGILIGDSYANHFTGMLDVLAKADGVTIMDYTVNACPPILGYSGTKSASYAARCALRNSSAFSLIERNKYDYVILAASWPSDEDAGRPIETTIQKVVDTGAQVIVVLSNQSIENAVSCSVRRMMFSSSANCSTARIAAPHYWANVRERFPLLRFIDPNEVICSERICSPVINGTLLYRDSSHLNDIGSRLIGRILLDKRYSLLHAPNS